MKAIDIETVPNSATIELLPEVEPKYGNAKDPEKRKAIEDKARQEQIDKMALNPFFGRVCCYGVANDSIGETECVTELSDDAERELLHKLFGHLKMTGNVSPTLITWNGNSFDLPFIYKRAMILGMEMSAIPPLSYWSRRYATKPHCDLMQVFCGWFGHLKLDTAARVVLGRSKAEIDVTKFVVMINAAKTAEISDYCLKDTQLTYELFCKAEKYLF